MTVKDRGITRRGFVTLAMAAALAPVPALAGDHPSMAYMRKVAKDLLHAHRQGTVSSFYNVISRHADVSGIALVSLGQYKSKLSGGQRARYYRGVATFMARYFADQSRLYPVAKYELGDAQSEGDEVLIPSKVFLMSGRTYTVSWRLAWRGKGYKVIDAKMLGFSLVSLQRGLFSSYISKRNGDVNALVAALDR
jgi:phospholipid transport system substrate-binding protein